MATRMSDDELEICEPRMLADQFGNIDPYYCGRLLLLRNVASKAERCLGGTFICTSCMDSFEYFMDKVANRQAVDEEFEES